MFGNDFELKHFSKDISLEVIINAMPAGNRSQYGSDENEFSGRGGSHQGGSMGEGRYGGMHGGGNRMGGGENDQLQEDRSTLFQKTELKQKIVLATPE